MRALFVLLCCFFVSAAAWAAPKGPFRYNLKTGACENAKKQKGHQVFDAKKLFGVTLKEAKKKGFVPKRVYSHVNAECVDFGKFRFSTVIRTGNVRLHAWNLRGALLDRSSFVFASMTRADLRGTRFRQLDMGYTSIQGRIDKFTTYPKGRCKTRPLFPPPTNKRDPKKFPVPVGATISCRL